MRTTVRTRALAERQRALASCEAPRHVVKERAADRHQAREARATVCGV
eukprot:SAG31_NODE_31044_length_373_cov_0.598540_1_plen_47_part_01